MIVIVILLAPHKNQSVDPWIRPTLWDLFPALSTATNHITEFVLYLHITKNTASPWDSWTNGGRSVSTNTHTQADTLATRAYFHIIVSISQWTRLHACRLIHTHLCAPLGLPRLIPLRLNGWFHIDRLVISVFVCLRRRSTSIRPALRRQSLCSALCMEISKCEFIPQGRQTGAEKEKINIM